MAQQTLNTTGRRKTSTARVFLSAGSGKITINSRSIEDYFGRETARRIVRQPLELTNMVTALDLAVTVRGGGNSGQPGAIRHGIARAQVEHDESLRSPLRRVRGGAQEGRPALGAQASAVLEAVLLVKGAGGAACTLQPGIGGSACGR